MPIVWRAGEPWALSGYPRVRLWPETVGALKEALARRPEPKDPADAGLAFVTKYGGSWAKDTSTNPVSQETRKAGSDRCHLCVVRVGTGLTARDQFAVERLRFGVLALEV